MRIVQKQILERLEIAQIKFLSDIFARVIKNSHTEVVFLAKFIDFGALGVLYD